MLLAAGEFVEKCGLAAILIPGKGKCNNLIFGQRVLVLGMVRGTHFAETGVLGVIFYHFFGYIDLGKLISIEQFYFDKRSVGKA